MALPSAPSVSPWMTAAEAAAYAKRGRRFILREIAAGRLRAARVGGRREILTRAEWIDQWIERLEIPVEISTRRKGAA